MMINGLRKNKLSVLILTFLIVVNFAPFALVFGENDTTSENQQPLGVGNMPEVPGLPENVVQYNKTDVVPVAQMEKVLSGEPVLFAYQNTTMRFNSTMNCDLVITAEATANHKIFGLTIDPNQTMTLTMNLGSSPVQSNQYRDKNLNFYASIEPNATVQLSAQLRLYINQTELSQELGWEVVPSELTWMYWNQTHNGWTQVPSFIDQDGYLTCNTDHFSVWTVGELADVSEQTDVADMTLVYGGVGAAIAIVLAVGIVVYKKRN